MTYHFSFWFAVACAVAALLFYVIGQVLWVMRKQFLSFVCLGLFTCSILGIGTGMYYHLTDAQKIGQARLVPLKTRIKDLSQQQDQLINQMQKSAKNSDRYRSLQAQYYRISKQLSVQKTKLHHKENPWD